MTRYAVELDRLARKDLRAIRDVPLRDALEQEIYTLADTPPTAGDDETQGLQENVARADGGLADRLPDRGRAVSDRRDCGGSRGRGVQRIVGCAFGAPLSGAVRRMHSLRRSEGTLPSAGRLLFEFK